MNFQSISLPDLRPPPWTSKLLDKPSTWWGHVPFAFWVTEASKPRMLVELGTQHGVSYAAFCEAVARAGLATRCYAVDSWIGDDQTGFYGDEVYESLKAFHDQNYASFSELIRSDFDSACRKFADASIDILHIDGLHTYDAVRHDFETWQPKLTARGVVLFHDTNIRRDEFGVWRFFEELSKSFPSFEFLHSCGLGVVAVGPETPEAVKRLCELSEDSDIASLREAFSALGFPWEMVNDAHVERDRLRERARELERVGAEREAALAKLSVERDSLSVERDSLSVERDSLSVERDSLSVERDSLSVERDSLSVERDSLSVERDSLSAERDSLSVERDSLSVERDTLSGEHGKLRRALESVRAENEAQRAVVAHAAERVALIQVEDDALRDALRDALNVSEKLVAYTSERYASAVRKRKLRSLQRRLWLACHKLPVRRKTYELISDSLLFEKHFYLSSNPDVRAAGIEPVVHYLKYGSKEGRDPSPWFSETGYLQRHPDVAASGMSAVEHYESQGRIEGRRVLSNGSLIDSVEQNTLAPSPARGFHPFPVQMLSTAPATANLTSLRTSIERSGLFDPSIYLALNSEVQRAGLDPWEHFLGSGILEGRRFTNSEIVAGALSRAATDIRSAALEIADRLAANLSDAEVMDSAKRLASAKIGIYCNSLGNFFMQEIANLLQWQLTTLGLDSHLRTEESSHDETFDIRIFIAPHEFFWLGRGKEWGPFASAPGSVLFNVEQMQTPWFCAAFPFLLKAPLVFDINFQSTIILRKAGCRVEHYTPPYLSGCKYTEPKTVVTGIDLLRGYPFSKGVFDWTQHHDPSHRPIDILFVGTGCDRRLKAIEKLRELTDRYRFICVYTHQTAPLTSHGYKTTSSEINCALAQRSKIVLNIHRDWIGYFEWSRMAMQGFWQGACVVSDPGLADPIFTPSVHYLEENVRHLPELLHWLLGTVDGQKRMNQVAAAGYRHATSATVRAAALAPMLGALAELVGNGGYSERFRH